jgi:hypothetical protein
MKQITGVIVAAVAVGVIAYAAISTRTASVLDTLDTSAAEREGLKSLLVEAVEIRHLATEGKLHFPDGFLDITCNRNFNVVSVYADIDSPDLGFETTYWALRTSGDFARDNNVQTYTFDLPEYRLPTGWYGYELLSGFGATTPIGIPAQGHLRIGMRVNSATPQDDTLRVDAVVETARDAECLIGNIEG